jgi:hypothetical protein
MAKVRNRVSNQDKKKSGYTGPLETKVNIQDGFKELRELNKKALELLKKY